MTLIEVVISAAIAIVMTAAFVEIAHGARPIAAATAADSFDAALAYAKSIASTSGNGATLVFAPAAPGRGFTLQIYRGRPNAAGALSKSAAPPFASEARAAAASIGAAPFTIFLDGAGYASAQSGAVDPSTVQAADPGCPGAGTAVTVTFGDGRTAISRVLPCAPP